MNSRDGLSFCYWLPHPFTPTQMGLVVHVYYNTDWVGIIDKEKDDWMSVN